MATDRTLDSLPDPPLPADLDLRDFPFMPLDVLRLRDSDFAAIASGEEFKAAVLLWCAAWHQVPAGSLPDDDRWLARHSGTGADWASVKGAVLAGFVRCRDGRLYHPVIAEKAREAGRRKAEQRERTAKARATLRHKREPVPVPVSVSVLGAATGIATDADPDPATDPKGQGERQGQGDSGPNSEAGASGAAAPRLFGEGVAWLRSVTGKPDARCRALIGRWRKDLGDDAVLAELIEEARASDVQAPESWFPRAIEHRRGEPPRLTVESILAERARDPAWRGVAQ